MGIRPHGGVATEGDDFSPPPHHPEIFSEQIEFKKIYVHQL